MCTRLLAQLFGADVVRRRADPHTKANSVLPLRLYDDFEDEKMSDTYEPHDRVRTEAHIKSVQEYKKR